MGTSRLKIGMVGVAVGALLLSACGNASDTDDPGSAADDGDSEGVESDGTTEEEEEEEEEAPPGEPEYELRWGHFISENGVIADVDNWFRDEIEARTDGRVVLDIGWAGAYGGGAELAELVGNGSIDFATTAAGYYPELMPAKALVNNPAFLFDSVETAAGVSERLFEEFPIYEEELASAGIHMVYEHHLSPYLFLGTSSDCSLSGLENTDVRAFGDFMPRAMQAVGMNPVSVLPEEWYESLQRGVVDYMVMAVDAAVSANLHEVGNNLCTATLGTIIGPQVFMNLELWESLPADIQQVFIEVGAEARQRAIEGQVQAEEVALEAMAEQGVELQVFPPADQEAWIEAAPDVIGEWVETMEGRGQGDQAEQIADVLREGSNDFEVDTSRYEEFLGD